MAISQVLLYNMALANLGEYSIAATTDDTKPATLCNLYWEVAYQGALQAGTWSFATQVADLTVTSETPDDWAYEYELPTDFLRAIEIPLAGALLQSTEYYAGQVSLRAEYAMRYSSSAMYFYCNVQDASLRYIYDNDTYAEWPSWFAEFAAARLSMMIAYPLTGKPGERERMQRLEQQMLLQAINYDSTTQKKAIPDYNKYTLGRG